MHTRLRTLLILTMVGLISMLTIAGAVAQAPGEREHVTIPREVQLRFAAAAKSSHDAEHQARQMLAHGDLAGAEATCRRAVEVSPRLSSPKTGSVPSNSQAVQLLGDIYLREGKNREALRTFLPRQGIDASHELNLDLVITYCRLKDYQHARQHFDDRVLMRGWGGGAGDYRKEPLPTMDVPDTRTLAGLEAGALLARGNNAAAETRYQDALQDYVAAERLAPKSPLVAYFIAERNLWMNNPEEAWPRYHFVVKHGHEPLVSRANKHIEGLKSWFYYHPSPKIGPIKLQKTGPSKYELVEQGR